MIVIEVAYPQRNVIIATKTGKQFKKVQQNLLHLGAIEVAFVNLFDTCHCAKQSETWIPCGRARDAVWGRDPAMRQHKIETAMKMQKNFQMNIFCGVQSIEKKIMVQPWLVKLIIYTTTMLQHYFHVPIRVFLARASKE